jgi:hypothetical protein
LITKLNLMIIQQSGWIISPAKGLGKYKGLLHSG